MAVYKAGKVTVTYNGVDIAKYFVDEADAMIDQFVQTIDADPSWFVRAPGEWAGSIDIPLRFVRVRPAAPIHSCLWRRNLDGGKWRKRGHAAHRS